MADEETDHDELGAEAGEGEHQGGDHGVGAGVSLETEDEGGQTEAEEDRHDDQRDDDLAEGGSVVFVRLGTGKAEHM